MAGLKKARRTAAKAAKQVKQPKGYQTRALEAQPVVSSYVMTTGDKSKS